MTAMLVVRDLRAAATGDDPSIHFDGRIDNKDDLVEWLELDRSCTDAELVRHAYLKAGDRCADRLLGDFAFAIWEPAERRIFCARDIVGVRPFYYRIDAGVFRASTELPAIVRTPGVPPPDEGMVAEHLSGSIASRSATLYQGVFRLPPGHALSVDARGRRVWPYWSPDPRRTITYRRDHEYEEHFGDVFAAAVAARTRAAKGPVGIMLSGGIDSASILAVAARTPPPFGIRAYSTVFPGHPADESPFIADILRTCPVPATARPAVTRSEARTLDTARRWCEVPGYPNGASDDLLAAAAGDGCRVMLTGLGGGEWVGGSEHHCADLLRRLRLRSLVAQILADRSVGAIEGPSGIVRAAVWPLLSPPLQDVVRSVRRRLGHSTRPPWIPAPFAARTNLAGRLFGEHPVPSFPTCAQRDMYRSALSGSQVHGLEACARTLASHGLEGRYPFHDRRLIEFALALPEDQRWRGREHKSILRRAMAASVPDSIRRRLVADDYGFLFAAALVHHVRVLARRRLVIAGLGWVDEELVTREYQRLCRDYASGRRSSGRSLWWLWMVAAVEVWFTTMYGGAQADAPDAHLIAV